MSTAMHRRARHAPEAGEPASSSSAPAPRSRAVELAGLLALGAALVALLTYHVLQVDRFFLDDWLYTHAAEYIGQHLPGALAGDIPNWTRGAQRLYPVLLAPPYATLSASAAFTVSHLVNVALLASAIMPAALLARRFVDGAPARVLAVALAVVLPPLTVGSVLLTENLAVPLLLWVVYAIVRTAETPTLLNQVAALAAIAALTLTRLNLAAAFGALVVTVAVAELLALREARGERRAWLVAALRRRAVIVVATLVAIAGAVWVSRSGGGGLGAYGGGTDSDQLREIWTERELVRAAAATYLRSMVTGAFVFPFVLGLAGALAALRGALGRRALIPAVATLSCFALVLLVVSAYTKNGPFEERYAFYLYPPLALFAVAAVQRLRRVPVELAIASLAAIWALKAGGHRMSTLNYHFFDAPSGAFWNRVVEHRLVRFEGSLPAWLPGSPSGWQLIAFALALLVVLVAAARFAARVAPRLTLVLTVGLVACAVAQALALNYSFGALLHGFPDAPGGLAGEPGHDRDRISFIDDTLPDGTHAAMLAPMPAPGSPYGSAELVSYWNRKIDAVVALRFNGAPIVASAGHDVVESELRDGMATWAGPGSLGWLVAARDDPRAQFAGEVVTPKGYPGWSLVRLDRPVHSTWVASGLEPDGYVQQGATATMSLDRSSGRVREVRLRLRAAEALPGRARYRIARRGAPAVTGRLSAGRTVTLRLRVPPCSAASACAPAEWRLTAKGKPAMVSLPAYGAVPPPRPVQVQLLSAELVSGG